MKHPATLSLAPLAGVTDSPFRHICKEYGAECVTTEMISAKGLWYHDKKTAELLAFDETERPLGVQLFGSDPTIMAYAAKTVEEAYKPDFIDINMGCPMRKIVQNGDGNALMKDPLLAAKIVESVAKSVHVPVTVKLRAGVDRDHVNAVEMARVCVSSGASRLCVHGRTGDQLYTGKSDRGVIRDVVNAVSVPVLGNGDIFTPEDAKTMLDETGCAGVMLARGVLGNPFLFEQCRQYLDTGVYRTVGFEERLETARRQVKMMCAVKPERVAVPEARKHVAWYVKGMKYAASVKNRIFTVSSFSEMDEVLCELTERLKGEGYGA